MRTMADDLGDELQARSVARRGETAVSGDELVGDQAMDGEKMGPTYYRNCLIEQESDGSFSVYANAGHRLLKRYLPNLEAGKREVDTLMSSGGMGSAHLRRS